MEDIIEDFKTVSLNGMQDIIEEFKNVEKYPFNCVYWDLIDLSCVENGLTSKTLQNLRKTDEDTNVFQNFVYYCTAMYNSAYVENDISEARKIFEKYMQCYINVTEDDLMREYRIAFKHIFLTFKAVLLHCSEENRPQLCNILREIPEFEAMDSGNKAAIFGTKAAILFEFGPFQSTLKGCELARLAINLDPTQGEWYFLNGKGLHRNRRAFRSKFPLMPSKEEMTSLERSVELSSTPSKLVFLAECYVDALKVLYENKAKSPEEEQIFSDMGLATLELFRRATCRRENTAWYIFLRCGMGYLRIPPPFTNYELAKEYFQLANALKPGSGFINHQLCNAYQKLKDYKNAFKYAQIASDFGIKWAPLDEVRLGLIMSRDHDVLCSLDRNMDKFNDYGKSVVLIQKGSYLLFEKKKLGEGLNFCYEGLKLIEHPWFAQQHSLCFNDALGTFSLPQYLDHLLVTMRYRRIITRINVGELLEFLQRKFPESVGKKPSAKIRSLVEQTLWHIGPNKNPYTFMRNYVY